MNPGVLRTLLRIAAAGLLLALAVALAGPERLRAALAAARPEWFLAAIASALAAQVVSVLRWRQIARIFGLRAPLPRLALAYAQGMTLNVLLPGATLGGDALRSIRLRDAGNPLPESALTVMLDRLSGLWVLCVLSLVTAPVLLASLPAGAIAQALPPGLPPVLVAAAPWAYVAGLALCCALPFLPLRLPKAAGTGEGEGTARRVLARLAGLHVLAVAQRGPLARSVWTSVLVQALSAMTLWFSLLAAGGAGPDPGPGAVFTAWWQVQAVAAPVFVAGALPLSYGGFGARELAALAAFPLVGVAAGPGVAASALYGLVAVVLGIATAPAFILRLREEPCKSS